MTEYEFSIATNLAKMNAIQDIVSTLHGADDCGISADFKGMLSQAIGRGLSALNDVMPKLEISE